MESRDESAHDDTDIALAQLEPLPPEEDSSGDWDPPHRHHHEASIFEGLIPEFIAESNYLIHRDSERWVDYQLIKENTPDAIIELTVDGTIVAVNPAFSRTFGRPAHELVDTTFSEFLAAEYRLGVQSAMDRHVNERFGRAGDPLRDIVVFRAPAGSDAQRSIEGVFHSFSDGEGVIVVLVLRDLSANRSLYKELQIAQDHYELLSETIGETIVRINEDFEILFANSAITKTFGYARDDVKGRHFSMLFPEGTFDRKIETFRKYFLVDDTDRRDFGLDVTIETLGCGKSRGVFPIEMSFGNSSEFQGRSLTCIIRDISERKHTERELRHLAYHDKLTGLGNRDLFLHDADALFTAMRERSNVVGALLFLDLDQFKQVNDTLGHDAGDRLLTEVARRIRALIPDGDGAYRFGGDEFVVLLKSLQSREGAAEIAETLMEAIRSPVPVTTGGATKMVTVGVSIGIAVAPEDAGDTKTMAKYADLAMYDAKWRGKNCYAFFSDKLNKRASDRWLIEQSLEQGLADGEFFLEFQPIYDRSDRIIALEALARWNRGEHGVANPSDFIPIAESSRFIVKLGEWLLNLACRKLKYLHDLGFSDLVMAVNISARQFESDGFAQRVHDIVERAGVAPRSLIFELTESCVMSAPETAIATMRDIKRFLPEVRFAVDDFGTGYSSLSYLSRLPVDILKIDRTFVMQISEASTVKIVNTVLNLAESLQLHTIAEGVETEPQRDHFRDTPVEMLQGFYLSPPLDFDALVGILQGTA